MVSLVSLAESQLGKYDDLMKLMRGRKKINDEIFGQKRQIKMAEESLTRSKTDKDRETNQRLLRDKKK